MEAIGNWILEDILKSIKQLGFSIEEAPLPYLHATTNSEAKLIIYNQETATLFELAEELIHATYGHRRRNKEYDVRNTDESDAHYLCLQFLLDRWNYYEGSENWLTFMTVTGTPEEFEDEIIESFTPHDHGLFNSAMLG